MNFIQTILDVWSKRTLSVLEKILVVNSLIIPLFTHRLLVTRTPEKTMFKKFKDLVRNFIWDGKKAKIAYQRLIRHMDNGGLKLVDLGLKNTALKIKWVQVSRLKEDCFWNHMLNSCMPVNTKLL